MTRSRRITAVAALVGGLSALGPAAWAYFTGAGSGTGSAVLATLDPPSAVSASASAGTVAVSWAGTTAPGGGPVDGYVVQRSTGPAGGTCASSASDPLPAATATCSDTGVAAGTYTYTVVAVYRSWTAAAAAPPVTVEPPALDRFELAAPASVTAGTSFTVTVTAKDDRGVTFTGYTGTVRFSSTDGQAGLPADATFTPTDAGTRTFTSGAMLRTAGSHSVAVADLAEPARNGAATVTVDPAAAARLAFSQQPTATTAGATIAPAVTVRIEDAFGNLTGSTADVGLTVNGGAALGGTTTRSAVAGVATFADLSITRAGGYTLSAAAPGLTGATSASFEVAAAAASKLAFTTSSHDCSSGTVSVGNGGTFTSRVSVVDTYGNPVAGASTRTVTLSNNRSDFGLSPTTLSVPAAASQTSAAFGQQIPSGNPPTHAVTASSPGLGSVTCGVRR